jgi:hypothetical protein
LLLGGGCASWNEALRFRVTVEVQTPADIRTGSSVLVMNLRGPSMLPGDDGSANVLGEAPTVDLGGGRFLFAVLQDNYWRRDFLSIVLPIVGKALRDRDSQPPRAYDSNRELMRKAAEAKAFGILRRQDYPMLVTFADVNDPSSVEEVAPDNLAASFGAGYALNRITLQAVDGRTPLTTGFSDRFPAIANHRGVFRRSALDTSRARDPAGDLQMMNFVLGARK